MKEIEKRLAEHTIKLPAGGTLREDVIVKHGIRIGWKEALKWIEAVATAIETEEGRDGFDIVDLHKMIDKELEEGLMNETKTE